MTDRSSKSAGRVILRPFGGSGQNFAGDEDQGCSRKGPASGGADSSMALRFRVLPLAHEHRIHAGLISCLAAGRKSSQPWLEAPLRAFMSVVSVVSELSLVIRVLQGDRPWA
jgi:hypothetical protein